MNRSLFISKEPDEVTDLVTWCRQQDIELHAQAMIAFNAVPFQQLKAHPIVFFSSKRAVQFYFSQAHKFQQNTLVACIGKATAAYLEGLGYPVHFCGEEAGEPEKVAEQFLAWVGERSVFFPVSTKSLQSISGIFPPNQCEVQEVYETIYQTKPIASCTTYVFSSPSNVEAFLMSNAVPKEAKCIAWGKSTAQALIKNHMQVQHTLTTASLQELLAYLSVEQA